MNAVLRGGNPVRRLWHLAKFERVLDCLPAREAGSILDIGCFAGSFLSMVPESQFGRQLGVDILGSQVEYARARYGTSFREFRHLHDLAGLETVQETFDCVTGIELIEHLTPAELHSLLREVARKLVPGGRLVITTPNYASVWPLLEALLNRLSEVKYEEQHITRFNYFQIERQLAALYPDFGRQFSVELKTTTHLLPRSSPGCPSALPASSPGWCPTTVGGCRSATSCCSWLGGSVSPSARCRETRSRRRAVAARRPRESCRTGNFCMSPTHAM